MLSCFAKNSWDYSSGFIIIHETLSSNNTPKTHFTLRFSLKMSHPAPHTGLGSSERLLSSYTSAFPEVATGPNAHYFDICSSSCRYSLFLGRKGGKGVLINAASLAS